MEFKITSVSKENHEENYIGYYGKDIFYVTFRKYVMIFSTFRIPTQVFVDGDGWPEDRSVREAIIKELVESSNAIPR